jgi:ankyrin repeat protein
LLFLLECAATVDAQNDAGDTPLHLAVWFGNVSCVASLLTYDASMVSTNTFGFDPYSNVMARSPLIAKKKKLPSDLRKALGLLVDKMPALGDHMNAALTHQGRSMHRREQRLPSSSRSPSRAATPSPSRDSLRDSTASSFDDGTPPDTPPILGAGSSNSHSTGSSSSSRSRSASPATKKALEGEEVRATTTAGGALPTAAAEEARHSRSSLDFSIDDDDDDDDDEFHDAEDDASDFENDGDDDEKEEETRAAGEQAGSPSGGTAASALGPELPAFRFDGPPTDAALAAAASSAAAGYGVK